MATLYSQTSSTTFSNYNWNSANDNYAFNFTPIVTWTPNELVLDLNGISWTPVCDFHIKAAATIASPSLWGATWVTMTSWVNTITLTWWSSISSWTEYWVFMSRTSWSSDYPQIKQNWSSPTKSLYRATAINSDPSTLWQTTDVKMTINGTLSSVFTPKIMIF